MFRSLVWFSLLLLALLWVGLELLFGPLRQQGISLALLRGLALAWVLGSLCVGVALMLVWLRPYGQALQRLNRLAQGEKPGGSSPVSAQEALLAVERIEQGLQKLENYARQASQRSEHAPYRAIGPEQQLGQAVEEMALGFRRALEQIENQQQHLFERRMHEAQRLARERTLALLLGQEAERKRLAQDLHDGIGQLLTAISMQANAMPESAQAEKILNIVRQTRTEIRSLANSILPSVLEDFGLEAALKVLCQNTTGLTGILVDLVYHHSANRRFESEVEVGVYRVIQEAVANAVKYADPRLISVSVRLTDAGLRVVVEDDGRGFDVPAALENKRKSFGGLHNMRERTEALGGRFEVESDGASFTKVILTLPVGHER